MIIKVFYLLGIYTATVRQLANLIHLQDLRNNIKLTSTLKIYMWINFRPQMLNNFHSGCLLVGSY